MPKLLSRLSALPLLAIAGPALAHPSHVESLAGHSHWLALAAFGSAAVIAVIGVARAAIRRRAETSGRAK